jgi:hypothetical protein
LTMCSGSPIARAASWICAAGGEIPPAYSPRHLQRMASSPFAQPTNNITTNFVLTYR